MPGVVTTTVVVRLPRAHKQSPNKHTSISSARKNCERRQFLGKADAFHFGHSASEKASVGRHARHGSNRQATYLPLSCRTAKCRDVGWGTSQTGADSPGVAARPFLAPARALSSLPRPRVPSNGRTQVVRPFVLL